MPCKFEDDDGDWTGKIMIIMRGNGGLLHVKPAKEYAVLKGYKPKVLAANGDPGPNRTKDDSDRDNSAGTKMALECFRQHLKSIDIAFYGFSGGGYNLFHILNLMTPDERGRVKLVAVVGVDKDTPESSYKAEKFEGGKWILDYMGNPGDHMNLPDKFLQRAKKQ